jgi:hypothetical protein
VVIENDRNHFLMSNLNIAPNIERHAITESILDKRIRPMLYPARAISTNRDDPSIITKASITVETLLVSSSNSYGNLFTSPTMEYNSETDLSGPIKVAVAITDYFYAETTQHTQIVVVSAQTILDGGANNFAGGANWEFVMNSLDWLFDKPMGVFIPAKTPPSAFLAVPEQQRIFIMVVAYGVFPGGILITGTVVWLRRRHS